MERPVAWIATGLFLCAPGMARSAVTKDGETQDGYTQGFSANRPGFFIFPGDPDCNNDRVFVITAATDRINFI